MMHASMVYAERRFISSVHGNVNIVVCSTVRWCEYLLAEPLSLIFFHAVKLPLRIIVNMKIIALIKTH